jgi:hypothetical protein
MEISAGLVLGIWGAIVSTALGVFQLKKSIQEKATFVVKGSVRPFKTRKSLSKSQESGEKETDEEAIDWDVELIVANCGWRSCQVTDVFIDKDSEIVELRPSGLPVILEPNTQIAIRVQREWFLMFRDDIGLVLLEQILAIGVYDAGGKRHCMSKSELAAFSKECIKPPLPGMRWQNPKTGEIITAFQSFDVRRVVAKNKKWSLVGVTSKP